MKPPPKKMHILGINFISFTAQIYNVLHVQFKKGRLLASNILIGGHGPVASHLPSVAIGLQRP